MTDHLRALVIRGVIITLLIIAYLYINKSYGSENSSDPQIPSFHLSRLSVAPSLNPSISLVTLSLNDKEVFVTRSDKTSVSLSPENLPFIPWTLSSDNLKRWSDSHSFRLVPHDESYTLNAHSLLRGGGNESSTGGGNNVSSTENSNGYTCIRSCQSDGLGYYCNSSGNCHLSITITGEDHQRYDCDNDGTCYSGGIYCHPSAGCYNLNSNQQSNSHPLEGHGGLGGGNYTDYNVYGSFNDVTGGLMSQQLPSHLKTAFSNKKRYPCNSSGDDCGNGVGYKKPLAIKLDVNIKNQSLLSSKLKSDLSYENIAQTMYNAAKANPSVWSHLSLSAHQDLKTPFWFGVNMCDDTFDILVNVQNIHDAVKLSSVLQCEILPESVIGNIGVRSTTYSKTVLPVILKATLYQALSLIGKSGDVVRPGFTWSLNANNDLSVLSKETGLNYPVFAPDRSKKNAFQNPNSPLVQYNKHPIYKDALHPIYELSLLWNEPNALNYPLTGIPEVLLYTFVTNGIGLKGSYDKTIGTSLLDRLMDILYHDDPYFTKEVIQYFSALPEKQLAQAVMTHLTLTQNQLDKEWQSLITGKEPGLQTLVNGYVQWGILSGVINGCRIYGGAGMKTASLKDLLHTVQTLESHLFEIPLLETTESRKLWSSKNLTPFGQQLASLIEYDFEKYMLNPALVFVEDNATELVVLGAGIVAQRFPFLGPLWKLCKAGLSKLSSLSKASPEKALLQHQNKIGHQLRGYFGKDITKKLDKAHGPPKIADKGKGLRWGQKPEKDYVRIDKGDSKAKYPTGQVDHVHVVSDGKIVSVDGSRLIPQQGKKLSELPEAHIPLTDYIKWKSWDMP